MDILHHIFSSLVILESQMVLRFIAFLPFPFLLPTKTQKISDSMPLEDLSYLSNRYNRHQSNIPVGSNTCHLSHLLASIHLLSSHWIRTFFSDAGHIFFTSSEAFSISFQGCPSLLQTMKIVYSKRAERMTSRGISHIRKLKVLM